MELPKLYKEGNNFHSMQHDTGILYFSYNTLIAFTHNGELVIRQNDWKTTTGKHLNQIDDDKSKRINSEEFEKRYTEIFSMEGK